MDEILFHNRNQAYGAYLLRRKYPKILLFSTLVTSAAFVFLLLLYFLWPEPIKKNQELIFFNVGEGLPFLPQQKQEAPPPSGGFYKAFQTPTVVDSMPVSDTLINQAEGNGTDTTGSGNGTGTGDGGGPILLASQQPPAFPGGEKERMRFLQQNINYPPLARQKKIKGIVYISFVVEKNGSISQPKILKGIGYGCDEEALRVINSMPRWTPGRQNGIPVRVQVVIPLHFVWQAT
jgi:protein TonB